MFRASEIYPWTLSHRFTKALTMFSTTSSKNKSLICLYIVDLNLKSI